MIRDITKGAVFLGAWKKKKKNIANATISKMYVTVLAVDLVRNNPLYLMLKKSKPETLANIEKISPDV